MVSVNNKVLKLYNNQPEFKISFDSYINRNINEKRIKKGKKLYKKNSKLLDIIFKKYNIPPQIIISIWALESNFGYYTGNFKIVDANIISPNVNLKKLLIKKNENNTKFEIENTTDLDKTNMFFQEILISGGKVLVNDKTYEVIGPIDSKVRLEYLFCTGEMFLPNYEKNR